jgi:hypothetical protein
LSKDEEKPEIEVETFGFFNKIHFSWDCGSLSSIRPDLGVSSEVKIDNCKPGKALTICVNAMDLELNPCVVVLGIQIMSSDGQKEQGSILSGIMNLNCNPMRKRLT